MRILKIVTYIMIFVVIFLWLFCEYICKMLNINTIVYLLFMVLISILTFISYFYIVLPKEKVNTKIIKLYVFGFFNDFDTLYNMFLIFLEKEKYVKYADYNTCKKNIQLFHRKYLFHHMDSYILVYNGDKYNSDMKKKIEEKYFGDYYTIYVAKDLSKKEIIDYLSYNEKYRFIYGLGLKRFLNILVDLKEKKIYISKVLKPNNNNSLYSTRLKKMLINNFDVKLLEEKRIYFD